MLHVRLIAFAALTSLLILGTTSPLFAQQSPSPKLEFFTSVQLGLAPIGVGLDVGLQHNASDKLAIVGRVAAGRPWQRVDVSGALPGGRLTEARLLERLEGSIGLRAYAKTNHTGWFGGLDYLRTLQTIEATSRRDATVGSALTDLIGIFTLGPFFDGSVQDVTQVSSVGMNGFGLQGGYAFDFGTGGRLEVAALLNHHVTNQEYAFDGLDGPEVLRPVSRDFNMTSAAVRVTYRVALIR